jgi:undecaprenyl-diphosphatase
VVWIVGGLLVLILAGIAVRDGDVDPWEAAIFHAINGLPDWLTAPMRFVELFGVLLIGPAVAIVALGFRKPRLALAALLVTASKLVLERVVKLLVERQRPKTSIPDAIARGVPVHGLAFVSGHVVLLAGLAGVASPYLRGRWRILPWCVVAFVGFARVYLGAHNPLDVVGGIGLGLAIAGIWNLVLGVPSSTQPRTPNREDAS